MQYIEVDYINPDIRWAEQPSVGWYRDIKIREFISINEIILNELDDYNDI